MTEKSENKVETLPDLDDLLQCPVCYEIPSGQIFQCNEGHHVCGRCKMRLDVCPVCRAFFFGTRNYAMEELISNVRKLRAFKLGGKVTTASPPPAEETSDTRESSSEETELTTININDDDVSSRTSVRAPTACRGLFRCLCCKRNPERLPLARLLNHIRYFHSPDLIESRSENGGYLQAWQFPTTPGRMVTAVRVHDMGIFFLVIEIAHESVHAWMSMAAATWVAHEFSYSFTLSGNDREAIFSDCVWSVRSCEGALKRMGHCLTVTGPHARALLTPTTMNGKLSVRRTPQELQAQVTQPRAVLRVANRSNVRNATDDVAHDLEPFLQDLQNDVARLSRAFATLGREANALVRSEAEMRARLESTPGSQSADDAASPRSEEEPQVEVENAERHMSRSARRRMRQRLRQAFMESQADSPAASAGSDRVARPAPSPGVGAAAGSATFEIIERVGADHSRDARADVVRPSLNQNIISRPQNNQVSNNATRVTNNGQLTRVNRPANSLNVGTTGRTSGVQNSSVPARATNGPSGTPARFDPNILVADIQNVTATVRGRTPSSAPPAVPPPPVAPPLIFDGPSNDSPANGNARNKKKRRQRR